jgi:hypothetical protein
VVIGDSRNIQIHIPTGIIIMNKNAASHNIDEALNNNAALTNAISGFAIQNGGCAKQERKQYR